MRRGEPWGEPLGDAGRTGLDVTGGDAALASAVAEHPDAVFRFVPSAGSDFARAIGLTGAPSGTTALICDGLRLPDGTVAVNAVVFGVAPDRLRWWHRRRPVSVEVDGRAVGAGRATTVVVANGQFLRGGDVVPRGHPGDGRIEVQVYTLEPRERSGMRARLSRGAHVPHPRIAERAGRAVTVRWVAPSRGRARRRPWEVDGVPRGDSEGADLSVAAGAVRVLV
jgi:hypothetical protein